MSLKIEWEGLEDFRRVMQNVDRRISNVMDEAGNKIGELWARRARGRVHVKTGRLRASIHPIPMGVEASASYAGYEEYGTRFRREHPFLRPAVEESRIEAQRILQDLLRRGFEE